MAPRNPTTPLSPLSPDSDQAPALSRTPSFLEFAPKRAMASFENLVALANYEERLREARKIVWRDRGERPVELQDLWECLEHGGRGGLRASGLAFAIRSGVNLILLMTRIKKVPRNYRLALIQHAAFGDDSVRFAAMLGSFVAVYKFVLNALPILLPEPSPRRANSTRSRSLLHRTLLHSASPSPDSPFPDDDADDAEQDVPEAGRGPRNARLSTGAQAHQVWLRKRTRRWYSVLAGALAGALAILFEKRGRRTAIGQQMFVRGLQGSFNAFSSKRRVRIPHGDVLVFAMWCVPALCPEHPQVELFPRCEAAARSCTRGSSARTRSRGRTTTGASRRGFSRGFEHDTMCCRITSASRLHRETLSIQRDLVRDGVFKISDMEALLARKACSLTRFLCFPFICPVGNDPREPHHAARAHRGRLAPAPGAHVWPALRPLRGAPPVVRLVHCNAGRPPLLRVPLDAAHLRRAARHPDAALPPAARVEGPATHAAARELGHRAELGVPGRVRVHIPIVLLLETQPV
ncbi:hypothetical protein AcW1_005072 [Taiwanofungus camphoratus]|nr:hypothetical protein AcW1_005072 [Antrodia cinnamomea]